jgi:hypothetical protein
LSAVLASVWDAVGAVASLISVAAVVVGGGWAYFKFVHERPYVTRSNLTVKATLVSDQVMRVDVTATAVGQARLVFVKDDEEGLLPPLVSVYALTAEMIQHPPDDWDEPLGATELFIDDDYIEAGETLQDVALVWLGTPKAGVLAYRVEASFTVAATPKDDGFTWRALDVVLAGKPVESKADGDTTEPDP